MHFTAEHSLIPPVIFVSHLWIGLISRYAWILIHDILSGSAYAGANYFLFLDQAECVSVCVALSKTAVSLLFPFAHPCLLFSHAVHYKLIFTFIGLYIFIYYSPFPLLLLFPLSFICGLFSSIYGLFVFTLPLLQAKVLFPLAILLFSRFLFLSPQWITSIPSGTSPHSYESYTPYLYQHLSLSLSLPPSILCVCVFVCTCVSQRKRERECVCVCVCVCVGVCENDKRKWSGGSRLTPLAY